jgi:hypothetical protein
LVYYSLSALRGENHIHLPSCLLFRRERRSLNRSWSAGSTSFQGEPLAYLVNSWQSDAVNATAVWDAWSSPVRGPFFDSTSKPSDRSTACACPGSSPRAEITRTEFLAGRYSGCEANHCFLVGTSYRSRRPRQ